MCAVHDLGEIGINLIKNTWLAPMCSFSKIAKSGKYSTLEAIVIRHAACGAVVITLLLLSFKSVSFFLFSYIWTYCTVLVLFLHMDVLYCTNAFPYIWTYCTVLMLFPTCTVLLLVSIFSPDISHKLSQQRLKIFFLSDFRVFWICYLQ